MTVQCFTFRYQQYDKSKKEEVDDATNTLSHFFAVGGKFPANHVKQKQMTDSLIDDLIIGCALPLSLTDNPKFSRYFSTMLCLLP